MERPRKQEQETARTEVEELGPNVLRMQLPIAMPGLGHVNMYALLDDRGAAIVDPGLPGSATWKNIQQRLGQADIKVKDVHTVIVTHSHPDHFGSAQRLADAAGAELVTHAAFHNHWMPHSHEDLDEVDPEDLMLSNPFDNTPWGSKPFRPPMRRRMMFRIMRTGLFNSWKPPTPTTRLRDGDVIKLAGREMFAVHTPGHTLDHLCIHDPEAGLLFSGDHVLQRWSTAWPRSPTSPRCCRPTAASSPTCPGAPSRSSVTTTTACRPCSTRPRRWARRRCRSCPSTCSARSGGATWPTARPTPTSSTCAWPVWPSATTATARRSTRSRAYR
ncbi:MAG: MBL fold metallo-hydrolase [Actinobacteria bacterium]|nr:MBL fold metallo-hydrolase [Actinomycetota bacterium]